MPSKTRPIPVNSMSREDVDRFWSFVDRSGAHCHPWTGKTVNGYGSFTITRCGPFVAHRIAYALMVGQLLDGILLRHSCDNPLCCNPGHLIPGTNYDNTMDSFRRGRNKDGFARPRMAMMTRGRYIDLVKNSIRLRLMLEYMTDRGLREKETPGGGSDEIRSLVRHAIQIEVPEDVWIDDDVQKPGNQHPEQVISKVLRKIRGAAPFGYRGKV